MVRPKHVWEYGYEDIAELTGNTLDVVRQHKMRGKYRPDDFESVFLYCVKYAQPELRLKMLKRLAEPSHG